MGDPLLVWARVSLGAWLLGRIGPAPASVKWGSLGLVLMNLLGLWRAPPPICSRALPSVGSDENVVFVVT